MGGGIMSGKLQKISCYGYIELDEIDILSPYPTGTTEMFLKMLWYLVKLIASIM